MWVNMTELDVHPGLLLLYVHVDAYFDVDVAKDEVVFWLFGWFHVERTNERTPCDLYYRAVCVVRDAWRRSSRLVSRVSCATYLVGVRLWYDLREDDATTGRCWAGEPFRFFFR